MDPFSGTWVANLEKSRRHANHQFQSATMFFSVAEDRVSLTYTGVNMSGKQESGTTILHPDGAEHPVAPSVPDVTVVTKWVGSRVLESVASRQGQIVGHSVYQVSDDGRTLTATVAGTDGAGKAFDQVIVFDRE